MSSGSLPSLASLLPDSETLLLLEPDDLAGYLIEFMNARSAADERIIGRTFIISQAAAGYPHSERTEVGRALMEAWSWLEREGMVSLSPHTENGFYFITRRGKQLRARADVEAYRKASRLPPSLLHPRLVQAVWGSFVRGDYATAIFQAFKEVEVTVREASGLSQSEIGVGLMRKAFDPRTGPLTDPAVPEGEREATSHLFSGAIGLYKNPASHRHVEFEDVTSVIELLLLASHLMRLVTVRG